MIRLLVALALLSAIPADARPIKPETIRVIDGDTIELTDEPLHYRLVGFDAPERSRPRCSGEASLAETSRDRLIELLAEEPLDLERVPCACRPGTEGTRDCNWGRLCGVLRSRGRDVGTILISEDLAVPYHCGAQRCPRKPKDWCEASGKP
jgi:micrococcal nuclease